MISYQTCWLKAHYPLEFAAATLDAESHNATKQLNFLRELKLEGIDYIPVDPEHSTDRWVVVRNENSAHLVGPLGAVHGIGPKGVDAILASRKNGKPIPAGIAKKLKNATTDIDSLYPVADRVKDLYPDLSVKGIKSEITPIKEIQCGIEGPVVAIAVITRIAPRDANDLANVAKRGGRKVSGQSMYLNTFARDDTDEIYAKVDRRDFDRLATPIIDQGKPGKSIYAIKGTVPADFRMIKIDRIIYLGDMTKDARERSHATNPGQGQGQDVEEVGGGYDHNGPTTRIEECK